MEQVNLTENDVIEAMQTYLTHKLEFGLENKNTELRRLRTITIRYGESIHLKYVPIGTHEVSIIYLVGHKEYGYETILMKNENIVHIDEIGYDDFLRFNTIEEVNEELNRLRQCEILFK